MKKIFLKDYADVIVDLYPEACPYCHKTIEAVYTGYNFSSLLLEISFKCPSEECLSLFIGRYIKCGPKNYNFVGCNIENLIKREFSNSINSISPSFIKIYNEAYFAEQYKLIEICGVGYRKAIEFLIKDYLIVKNPMDEDNIKKKFLGNCIKEDIINRNIKKAAERAVWLGNDETHYVKTWESKNIQDLKKLIEITIHWIEMEELTSSLDEDMPSRN